MDPTLPPAHPGEAGNHTHRDRARFDPDGPAAAVTALTAQMRGRWEVRAQTSRHIWDLDRMLYVRLPGPHAPVMPWDEVPVRITRVTQWPQVGARSLLLFDDPHEPVLEHWRICSTIQAIVALP